MICERLEQLAAQPVVAAMRELAQPAALAAIAALLGVTPPPLGEGVEVSDTIMHRMDGGPNPELIESGCRAREQLSDLVASWFTTTGWPRRAGPRRGQHTSGALETMAREDVPVCPPVDVVCPVTARDLPAEAHWPGRPDPL
ncbi:hypothetical protein ACFXKI_25825 [Streptomyces mirabilis]|uniref:hypothetical protein n=1 Tax=Streptomyces mirabilis TaxID=68239 RepID=UPI0036B37C4C